MPTSHQARFSLTIEDSKGRIFTESFYLTEGDYLPGFIASDEMKQSIKNSVNQGQTVYLPQGAVKYEDFSGSGYGVLGRACIFLKYLG
jgi:hypothetical protein